MSTSAQDDNLWTSTAIIITPSFFLSHVSLTDCFFFWTKRKRTLYDWQRTDKPQLCSGTFAKTFTWLVSTEQSTRNHSSTVIFSVLYHKRHRYTLIGVFPFFLCGGFIAGILYFSASFFLWETLLISQRQCSQVSMYLPRWQFLQKKPYKISHRNICSKKVSIKFQFMNEKLTHSMEGSRHCDYSWFFPWKKSFRTLGCTQPEPEAFVYVFIFKW